MCSGRQFHSAWLRAPRVSTGLHPLPGSVALPTINLATCATCRHMRYYPPSPGPLTDKQLRRLAAPLYVVCAEHDVWGADCRSLRHAQAVWPPAQLEALLLPGAKHVPSQGAMLEACHGIARFFEQRGLAG